MSVVYSNESPGFISIPESNMPSGLGVKPSTVPDVNVCIPASSVFVIVTTPPTSTVVVFGV